ATRCVRGPPVPAVIAQPTPASPRNTLARFVPRGAPRLAPDLAPARPSRRSMPAPGGPGAAYRLAPARLSRRSERALGLDRDHQGGKDMDLHLEVLGRLLVATALGGA